MRFRRFVSVLTLFLATAGSRAQASEGSVAALAGTHWRLVEFQSMDDRQGITRPRDGSRYTLWLHRDGTVTMQLHCNRAKGTWSAVPASDVSSGLFTFGPLAATRAQCSPPSMDGSILAKSRFVRSYLLKEGRLYLSLLADGGIYVWARDGNPAPAATLPAAPESGGPRNWQVTSMLKLHEQPNSSARVLASYRPGTVLDNLGCQRARGRVWCDVQPLGGGPRGYVPAESLRPSLSPDGSAAMGPDDSAWRAGLGMFEASGALPCALSPGQPMGTRPFGVARAGGGDATVVVTKPDRRTRAIVFRMGRPIGADTSQADGYPAFRATRNGDLHLVRVGNERYEIVDAIVLGG